MPLSVRCTCGKSLRVKDEMAGRRIKCPACANGLTVPSSMEPPVVSNENPSASDVEPMAANPKASSTKRNAATRSPVSLPWLTGAAAAILGVLLVVSILVGGWQFLRNGTLQSRLSDAEETTQGHIDALEQQKKDAAAANQALRKQVADAEQKAQANATKAAEQLKKLTAAENEVKEHAGKLDKLQQQLALLEQQLKKPIGKPDPEKVDEVKALGPDLHAFGQAPPDGFWAEYTITTRLTGAGEKESEFTQRMRQSIGSTLFEGKKCRWLEVQSSSEKPKTSNIVQVLFQEVGSKEKPERKLLRAIRKEDDHDFEQLELNSPEVKAFNGFLDPLLKNRKELGTQELAMEGIGKVACAHESGNFEVSIPGEKPIVLAATLWRSKQVPFNLVKNESVFEIKDGGTQLKSTSTVELVKFGQNASRVIPDNPKISPGRATLAQYAGNWSGKGITITIYADGTCDGSFNFGNVFSMLKNGKLQPKDREYSLSFAVNQTFLNWSVRLSGDRNTLTMSEPGQGIFVTLTRVK